MAGLQAPPRLRQGLVEGDGRAGKGLPSTLPPAASDGCPVGPSTLSPPLGLRLALSEEPPEAGGGGDGGTEGPAARRQAGGLFLFPVPAGRTPAACLRKHARILQNEQNLPCESPQAWEGRIQERRVAPEGRAGSHSTWAAAACQRLSTLFPGPRGHSPRMTPPWFPEADGLWVGGPWCTLA